MEWQTRREETRTGITDDGEFVIVLRHVEYTGKGQRGQRPGWSGEVLRRDTSAVCMTGTDTTAEAVQRACEEWLQAFSVARERDPLPR